MRRRPLIFAVASVALIVGLQAIVSWPAKAQAVVPFCQPGQAASFVFGIAALRDRLGATMGTPIECEHRDAESGDTIQHTTTGLAYYRPSINTAMFTDGSTHWALTNGTTVRWQGDDVTPPLPTEAEAAYLQATQPFRTRVGTLQRRLNTARQQMERGQADAVDADGLSALVDDMRTTRDALVKTQAAGRLFRYHGMLVVSLNEGMGAAVMLAQARQIQPSDARDRLLASAERHGQESERLQAAAAEAYSKALPVVVQ
jgi:hypothetical protein